MNHTANIINTVSRVRNWPGRCRNFFRKTGVQIPLSVALIAALSGCSSLYNESSVTITVGNHTILPELSSKTGEYKLTIFHTIDGLHVTFPATSNNSVDVSIAYTNNTSYSVGYGFFNSTNIKSLNQSLSHNIDFIRHNTVEKTNAIDDTLCTNGSHATHASTNQ